MCVSLKTLQSSVDELKNKNTILVEENSKISSQLEKVSEVNLIHIIGMLIFTVTLTGKNNNYILTKINKLSSTISKFYNIFKMV